MGNLSSSLESLESKELSQSKPLISFGLLTDIQYADCDDLIELRKKRYYRNSLVQIQKFIKDMNEVEAKRGVEFKFILQLGDLLDAATSSVEIPLVAMNRVLSLMNAKKFKPSNDHPCLLHVWGNHEFYNFKRHDLVNTPLNSARSFADCNEHSNRANYYSVQLTDNLRLICLDFYVVSVLGYSRKDPAFVASEKLLYQLRNQTPAKMHSKLWPDKYRRFNGALGDLQMEWLKSQLDSCQRSQSKAIVCGHIPLHPKSASSSSVAWNNDEIMATFDSFSGTVVAYMAGHYHPGGYCYHNKIHYITFAAVLECHPKSQSYAMIHVHKDRVSIVSKGDNPSLTISLL